MVNSDRPEKNFAFERFGPEMIWRVCVCAEQRESLTGTKSSNSMTQLLPYANSNLARLNYYHLNTCFSRKGLNDDDDDVGSTCWCVIKEKDETKCSIESRKVRSATNDEVKKKIR